MLSISHLAKLANVSARTLRYYESIGLIDSGSRGENNYRYYGTHLVDRVKKIKDLQDLGFSLDEIKTILQVSQSSFAQSLRRKLDEVDGEILALRERHLKLTNLLSVSQKIDSGESINETERKEYMEAIHEEVLVNLKNRHGGLSSTHLNYLKRDRLLSTPEQREFVAALMRCLEFAKQKKLRLGPSRGSSSASLVLYALGLNDFDPTQHGLVPERLLTQAPNIHIDVEYERGQEFVDFCRETTAKLQYGQIQAFKMPLLDIMNNVDARLGKAINYREIPDDSPEILSLFRKGDIEKIFSFDYSPDALIMKWENFIPGYEGSAKMADYLRNQKIVNFRDIVNITALWRPNTPGMLERIERYRLAKEQPFTHTVLAPELQKSLANNFGVIIYHEDILRAIAHYTGWDLERCNLVRRVLANKDKREKYADFHEFKKAVPADVFELLMEENLYGFCEPHAIAFSYFTKATAVLKAFHHDIYLEEIAKWEERNGFRWDDIGVNWKGVSIHQN